MDILIKAAAAGIISAVITLLLKKDNPSFSFSIGVMAVVFIMLLISSMVADIIEFTKDTAEAAGLSSALTTPIIKIIGIGIVSKVASDVCNDAGQSSIASTVEIAGSVTAFYIAMPLLQTVMEMVGELL